MVFQKKLILLMFILLYLTSNFASSNALELPTNQKSNLGSGTGQIFSGNVKIVLLNLYGFYSDSFITEINNFITNDIKSEFSNLTFNISVISNSSINLESEITQLLNDTTIENAIIIGAIGVRQEGLVTNSLKKWSNGTILRHINHIGLVDFNRNFNFYAHEIYNNLSFVTFTKKDAGFMAGIKSATLTKSNHVGLILDDSSKVTFSQFGSFSSTESFNTVDFVNAFISGVQYASEFLLGGRDILVKSTVFNAEGSLDSPDITMASILNDFEKFGADSVFNMESKYDDLFLSKAKALNMDTGLFGGNNSVASFSLVKNTPLAVKNLLLYWNSTQNTSINYFKYSLVNSSLLALSDYSYTGGSLETVQHLVLNGSISLSNIRANTTIIPGYDIGSSIVAMSILLLVVSSRRRKN